MCKEPVAPASAQVTPPSRDWHCYRFRKVTGAWTSDCWPSQQMCQVKRSKFSKARRKSSSACAGQRVGYCIHIAHGDELFRQDVCAGTMDDCQDLLKHVREGRYSLDVIRPCQPMLNTDHYKTAAGFDERRLRE